MVSGPVNEENVMSISAAATAVSIVLVHGDLWTVRLAGRLQHPEEGRIHRQHRPESHYIARRRRCRHQNKSSRRRLAE